LDGLRTHEF